MGFLSAGDISPVGYFFFALYYKIYSLFESEDIARAIIFIIGLIIVISAVIFLIAVIMYLRNIENEVIRSKERLTERIERQTRVLLDINESLSKIDKHKDMRPNGVEREIENVNMIEKYKSLLDMGAISEEEFASKKKELLGI